MVGVINKPTLGFILDENRNIIGPRHLEVNDWGYLVEGHPDATDTRSVLYMFSERPLWLIEEVIIPTANIDFYEDLESVPAIVRNR